MYKLSVMLDFALQMFAGRKLCCLAHLWVPLQPPISSIDPIMSHDCDMNMMWHIISLIVNGWRATVQAMGATA